MVRTTSLALLLQATCGSALAIGMAPRLAPATASASASPAAFAAPLARAFAVHTRARGVRMAGYDEFLATDVATGERKIIGFEEKEKLYLDCLAAYYNNEKAVLPDDEYEGLKRDLEFAGSKVAGFSKDEIKFLVANKRYREDKPVLDDNEYNALRLKLKEAGSMVVLHEAPSCRTVSTYV